MVTTFGKRLQHGRTAQLRVWSPPCTPSISPLACPATPSLICSQESIKLQRRFLTCTRKCMYHLFYRKILTSIRGNFDQHVFKVGGGAGPGRCAGLVRLYPNLLPPEKMRQAHWQCHRFALRLSLFCLLRGGKNRGRTHQTRSSPLQPRRAFLLRRGKNRVPSSSEEGRIWSSDCHGSSVC